jgi:uncharacterized protein YjcR
MTAFLTEAQVAEMLGEPEEKVAEWRRRYGWPHVKIGRQVRYTESDVQAIGRLHHVEAPRYDALPGQTSLSAARSR